MTELEIQERWPEIWAQCEGYDYIYMVGDDSVTRPQALQAVRELLWQGHPVVTGYANLDRQDWRLNIDRAPVSVDMGIDGHDFYTLEEALTYPEKAIPTTLCGFCPTGMSYQHWLMFPFRAEYGSDLSLSVRLQNAGVPIVAAREAFCWHVKETWNRQDAEPRKKLLIGIEPAAVELELA